MKNLSFVQMVVMLVLVATLASCGFSQPLYEDGDYADRRMMRRDVFMDPYYGNAPMLVRDPYTGQLYEVTPVGPGGGFYPGASAYPYGTRGGYYGNRTYNRGTYNNNSAPQRVQPQPQQQPSRSSSEKIDRARDIINGKQ